MKRQVLLIITILLLALTASFAQHEDTKFAITTKANFIDNLTPLDGFNIFNGSNLDETTKGIEVGFYRNINKFINVGIPLKLNSIDVREAGTATPFVNKMGFSADLVGQIGYFKSNYIITPYLQGGVGYQLESKSDNNESGVAFPVGVGFNLKIARELYINAQSEYRFSGADNRDQIVHGVGLVYGIGGSKTPKPVDTDGDGVTDVEDECPEQAGTAALGGCPDTDGDGITDKNDECPDVPGLKNQKGCPDTDGDGVIDKDDECPEVPGPIAGCPVLDQDNDGVADADDQCPNEPGTIMGCPDSDGDGVADKDDRCPNEVGNIENNGCPIVFMSDSDGDGVADADDRCPNSAGPVSNQGCPQISQEDREILNFALSNVEFNTGLATLLPSSNQVLNQIVGLMQKYPDYHLTIAGHTDSIGGAKTNQILSERRAKSCYDYLVLKGVDASRMNYVGYGETQPIADNKYKAGREQNRRVEFNLYLR